MPLFRLRPALSLLALATTVVSPSIASADPQTFVAPSDASISVTLSDTTLYPGQRVSLSGTGFVGAQPNPDDPNDLPLVAIKPYDVDRSDFVWGSDTGHAGSGGADSNTWFVSRTDAGTWAGWIQIPATVDRAGEGGEHWFRILSGAFSTTSNGNAFVGNVGDVVTYRVPFTIVDRDPIGLTAPNGTTFQAGTTFRPGAVITPRLTEFPASRPITASLENGAVVPVTSAGQPAATTAAGTFAATTRATLPTGLTPGSHQLTFAVAPVSGPPVTTTYDVTVTAAPTAMITTPAVRPGGRIDVSLSGYVGVSGAGQKVAVVVNEQTLACITAAADGTATGSAVVPATTPEGPLIVGFNVGTSCAGPTGAQDDLPAGRLTATTLVSADAPEPTPLSSPTPAPAALPAVPSPGPSPAPLPASTPVATPPAVRVAPAPKTATVKGDKITLTLTGAAVNGTKIQIATSQKVKLAPRGKARTVVLAKTTTDASGTIVLKLTADGKRALRRYGKLKVKLTVTVPGTRRPATKTVTLRA